MSKTSLYLYKYYQWPVGQRGEKSVIHALAKSNSSKIPVYPDDRDNSHIDFLHKMGVARLINRESFLL